MRIPSILLLLTFSIINIFGINSPKYEIRAVWLTTVYGLDWPNGTAQSESAEELQQQRLCRMLDQLEQANFNTVFLQVRLRGDVIYPSAIEPFSSVFTGKTNKLPSYDPLAFAIEECHKRGMECHAWFVTFPLGTTKAVASQGNHSVVKRHPGLCKRYNGEWYLDPGVPETTDYILSLVKEIVDIYDVDGIHFDYIRYPENAQKFPDSKEFKRYGNGKRLNDWRRDNINRMVTRIYDQVKAVKPWVQVSSSPLGKYNRIEKVPNAGWTAFESVYQDPAQWMAAGKHDMISPMMYYQHHNFYPFVDNWMEIANGRLFVPGLGAYRMDKGEGDWSLTDLTEQIDYSRETGTAGATFFRAAHVLNDLKGLYGQLKDNYYKRPAMLPPLTWLTDTIPAAPGEILVERNENELKMSWKGANPGKETYTVYYSLKDSIDLTVSRDILATGIRGNELYLPVRPGVEIGFTFCVTATDRFHIESEPSRETFYYLSDFIK